MPHVTHESHEIAIEIAIDRLARRRPTTAAAAGDKTTDTGSDPTIGRMDG